MKGINMKKIVLLMVLVCFVSVAFAGTGWFDDYIELYVNGNDTTYYLEGSGVAFHGHNLGGVGSLLFTQADMKCWADNGDDRTGGEVWYMIKSSDGSEIIVEPVQTIWSSFNWIGGNNYQGNWGGSKDLLTGLTNGVTYQLHFYAKSWGNSGGDSWLNNGGSNYVAYFTKAQVPAPVTLASFTAEAEKGKVELAWVTESETENSHFLVYRDGEVIAQVEGAGTTSETNEYAYTDVSVVPGVHEYAIADVTFGGVEALHDAVTVEVGATVAEASFVLNKAYPNPFNPRVVLSMEYGAGSNSVVNIYSTQGVLVDQLINGFVEAGHHEVIWDASDMTSGVYIVKMIVGDVMQSQKIVLMK